MAAKTTIFAAALTAVLLAAAGTVVAQDAVPLRFSPADAVVAPGMAPGRLSVLIDDDRTIRTIDITVTYDTTYVRSLGGAEGALFTDSGYQLFKGYEEPEPGVWHGYCIVMGSGLSVSGPGELYTWDFEGVAEGVSPITAVVVDVSDVDGIWYPSVDLAPTTIVVANPGLRFTPADQTVLPGSTGRLSVALDTPLTVRTIDITVTYDPTIVRSLGGTNGLLFLDSGHQLFSGFEEPEPGVWHGYCIVLGSGLSVQGYGELYRWEFEGLVEGVSPITGVTVDLSDVTGDWYPDVSIDPTTITVGSPPSSVPPATGVLDLNLAPNPFNPRTIVAGELAVAAPVRLTVHDARGRLVAVLHDGPRQAGAFTFAWDGRDRRGRAAPGGLYLFRLQTDTAVQQLKGVLLK